MKFCRGNRIEIFYFLNFYKFSLVKFRDRQTDPIEISAEIFREFSVLGKSRFSENLGRDLGKSRQNFTDRDLGPRILGRDLGKISTRSRLGPGSTIHFIMSTKIKRNTVFFKSIFPKILYLYRILIVSAATKAKHRLEHCRANGQHKLVGRNALESENKYENLIIFSKDNFIFCDKSMETLQNP